MKKGKFLTTVFIAGLLLLVAIENCLLSFALANPNPFPTDVEVPPPVIPTITFLSPENNSLHGVNNLTVGFKTSIKLEKATVGIKQIYYKASWKADNIIVYLWNGYESNLTEYSQNLSLNGIPEGNQTLTVTVRAEGSYYRGSLGRAYFFPNASSTIAFTVDITSPNVSVLESKNTRYTKSEVPLSFTVNEAISKISYVLDGQGNVTIDGNATLTGLPNGMHNVTVYAWDAAGNVGSSETVTFTVAKPEPFPAAPVAVASAASVGVAGVGLLLYFRKRKR
jgi:hypothetical protein